ncbi:hypothetical protein RR47_GL000280 [Enterococcus columbae DSM 7374 = ATCC 51263]|nr:hypothetical protein RR47_GL000280 [Enterococcus columbae DSM 7374 = ATCC 51263]
MFFLLITLLFDGISCYLGYSILGGMKFINRIQRWGVAIIFIVCFSLFVFYFFDFKDYFSISLSSTLVLILLTLEKEDRLKSIGIYLFIFLGTSTIGVAEIFILMSVYQQSFEQLSNNMNIVIAVDFGQISLLFIIYYLRKKIFKDKYIKFNKSQYVIFNLIILAITVLISVLQYLDGKLPIINDTKILLVISILLCLLLLFLAVYQAYLNTNQQLLREKNQLQIDFQRMQQMYYESILKQNEDIRRFKHDFNGHLQTIRYLNSQKSSQELEHYLQKIAQQANIHLQTKYTGNKVVDILLLDLCNQAHLNEIEVRIDGYLPNQLFIEDFDLTTICFNLFKNALEAVSQVSVQEERVIDIFVDYVDQTHFVMEIKNTISQKVEIKDNQITTSKADGINHGIGLKNVAATVEKYEGYLSLASSEKVFSVKLFM